MPDRSFLPVKAEFDLRPVLHRTFGPGQQSLFLPITDPRYSLHRFDDITIAGLEIAAQLPPDIRPIKRGWTDKLYSNFSRNLWMTMEREQIHLGAGLRTPDDKAFVKVTTLAGRKSLPKARQFYAVGRLRAADTDYRTDCVEWDHEVWKERYPATYENWLAHLFWGLDASTGLPQRPKGGKLEQKKSGGPLMVDVPQSTRPPGWPLRCHRDEKACLPEYKKNSGKSCVVRCDEVDGC